MWLSKTQNRSAAAASLRKESHITASSRPFRSGGRLSLCSQMWICRASFCCRQVFALQPDVKLQVFLLLQTVFCFTARSGTAVLLFDWREAATGQQLHLQLWTFCSGCLPQVFQTPRATLAQKNHNSEDNIAQKKAQENPQLRGQHSTKKSTPKSTKKTTTPRTTYHKKKHNKKHKKNTTAGSGCAAQGKL